MAEGSVSAKLAEWLIVFLILFSLVTEILLHRLEHWVAHRHVHLQAVLRNLYRELMILGIISFGFVMYEISEKPEGDVVVSFEVAHFFIFLFAVFHTFVVMCTIFMSLRLSYTWKKLERMELIQYLELKDSYRKLREQLRRHKSAWWRYLQWWFPNPLKAYRYLQLHEAMAFHDIRFQFIYYRNLPPDFRFSSFLRKIKAATFIELVEVHWSLYVFFLAVVLGDIVRRSVFDFPPEFDPSFMIAEATLNAILVTVLSYKIRRVYWKLTKHPATYYDKVDKNILEEELKVAKKQQRSEVRRSRHSSLDGIFNNAPDESGNNGDDETDERDPSKSVDRERVRPRTSLGGGLEFRGRNPGSRGTSLDGRPATAGFERKADGRITNLAYKPPESPASVHSSGHNSGREGDAPVDVEETAVKHSMQLDRVMDSPATSRTPASSMDFSRRTLGNSRDVWSAMLGSDDNSADNTSVTPSVDSRPLGSPISVAEIAVAAARRRSLERLSSHASEANPPDPAGGGRKSLTRNRAPLDGPASRNSAEGRGSTRNSLELPAGRTSLDAPMSARSSVDGRMSKRGSVDNLMSLGKGRSSRDKRQSIELVHAMPHDELAERHSNSRSYGPNSYNQLRPTETLSMDESETGRGGAAVGYDAVDDSKDISLNLDASEDSGVIVPEKNRKYWNPSIVRNAQQRDQAEQHSPDGKYPRWLVKLLPRLGRAASPAEKLFWFGSHRFFIWCVEWTFFFATIDVAVTSATFAMIVRERNEKAKKDEGKPKTALRAEADESKDGKDEKDKEEDRADFSLYLAALLVTIVSLLYVLVKIAGIMKRYIFVLNNASLLPESATIQAIHNVRLKRHLQYEAFGSDMEGSGASGSDTEPEDAEAARERRRKYWGFFQGHAKEGHLPSEDDDTSSTSNRKKSASRDRLYATRRRAEARRLERARNTVVEPYLPEVPTESTIDVGGMDSDE